jgi:fatty acid desaturase
MPEGKQWGRVDGWRGVGSLALEWVSIGGVMGLAAYLHSIPSYLAAIILVGALQHRLAALGHEAAHGMLFRSRFCNDAAADALCFFPVLATIHHYRRWHLAHHAAPNDPRRDPDVLNLGRWLLRDRFPMSRGRMVWLVFLRWVSAPLSFVRYGWSYLRLNTFGRGAGLRASVTHHPWYPPRVGALARAAFYAASGLALCALGPGGSWLFATLWVVPLVTTFPYFLMLRDTFQHTNADAGRYTNTRVFRVHPVVRWAVFPYGQDLHLPHHASPGVPHYRLEALHRHLLASRAGYGPAAVECRGVLWNRTGEPTIADALAQGS